jgi:hypothetical protein
MIPTLGGRDNAVVLKGGGLVHAPAWPWLRCCLGVRGQSHARLALAAIRICAEGTRREGS